MGTVREIRIARRTGFCYGVREAIDKAKEARAAGKSTHTLGQVVHNEGVDPRPRAARASRRSRRLDDVDHGAAVVIRAHGVRPDVMERAERAGPRGHRRHLHLGHPGAPRARRSSSRRATRSSCSARRTTPRSSGMLGFAPDAIVVDEEDEWEPKIPRQEADGADQPVDPAAVEVREARRVHGRPEPRAQDRQHRLPGDDPPPGGHGRGRPRGRPDGRRRRPVEREHEGADAARRDRRQARDPDRGRAAT